MEFLIALDRIKQGMSDSATEILAAINDRVSALESDVNLWKKRHGNLETQLTEIKADTGDKPKEYLDSLKVEIEGLKTKIKGLEDEKTTLQGKVDEFEKTALYNNAAQKAKVNADALTNLIKSGIIPNDIKIEGEEVKIAGVAIADYLKEPGREWIKNALTITGGQESNDSSNSSNNTPPTSPNPSTPSGGMQSGSPPTNNPVAIMLSQRGFAIPKT